MTVTKKFLTEFRAGDVVRRQGSSIDGVVVRAVTRSRKQHLTVVWNYSYRACYRHAQHLQLLLRPTR